MKNLTIIAFGLLMASCSKNEGYSPSHCQQCVQVVSDSTTGDTIKINYGSPSPTDMYYCDGALNQVKSQPPVYFHNTVILTGYDTLIIPIVSNGQIHRIDSIFVSQRISHTQKYQYHCN